MDRDIVMDAGLEALARELRATRYYAINPAFKEELRKELLVRFVTEIGEKNMVLDHYIGRRIKYNLTGETGYIKSFSGTMITMQTDIPSLEIGGLDESDITFLDAPLLDWQRIHNWTAKHPNGAIVGKARTNMLCPLAEYLNAQTGTDSGYWSVGPCIKHMGTQERLEMTKWINALMALTDKRAGEDGVVTRDMFLEVLDEVKAQELRNDA